MVVIVVLLFLNGRSTSHDAGPVVTPPIATASSQPPTASQSPSPTPSQAPTPTNTASAPPVTQPSATAQPAVAKVPLTVLNNSRKAGLGHDVAAEVHARGWPIAKIGNYRGRLAMTTVYYAPGQLPQARELAREFPQIKRILPRFDGLPGQGLTLVVTRDWT